MHHRSATQKTATSSNSNSFIICICEDAITLPSVYYWHFAGYLVWSIPIEQFNTNTAILACKTWLQVSSGAAERFWKWYAKLAGVGNRSPPSGVQADWGSGGRDPRSWSTYVTDTLDFEAYVHVIATIFATVYSTFCYLTFNLAQRGYFSYNM